MREQAVIPHADSPAACDPEQGQCDPKCLPGEKEKCGQGSSVKHCERARCDPIQSRRVIGHIASGRSCRGADGSQAVRHTRPPPRNALPTWRKISRNCWLAPEGSSQEYLS